MIALSNVRVLRRLGKYPLPSGFPSLSVLIPAQNEEANIQPCVRSLLTQEYPDFEISVLNDNSTDGTGRELAALAAQSDLVRILRGKPLPPDWLGKHWACHQLAQAAKGELLLFTDADTRHHPLALRDAVAALLAEEADLLTALPQQEVVSWAEQLIVPVLPWSIFSFLPIGLAHRLRWPALSAAAGQLMLFRRQAYEQVGGHSGVRQHGTDDLALARKIKAQAQRLEDICQAIGSELTDPSFERKREILEAFGLRVRLRKDSSYECFGAIPGICQLLPAPLPWSRQSFRYFTPS